MLNAYGNSNKIIVIKINNINEARDNSVALLRRVRVWVSRCNRANPIQKQAENHRKSNERRFTDIIAVLRSTLLLRENKHTANITAQQPK